MKPGIIVLAITKNNLYKIIKGDRDQYDVIVEGGKISKPSSANFSGSTFGGSMMKIGWIGYDMHMEFYLRDYRQRYRTTGVQAARVIGPGWEYDMEWENMDICTEPKIT